MKVLAVLGTRPEIIRLSRVIERLDRHCDLTLVHTGQNFDPSLSDVFFDELGVRAPDRYLGIEGDGFADFRGASTIPMQVAKNLYLWNSRSYLRKLIEMPLAYIMSFIWPKQRMMEVYLNVAQWGPGIFGAEAASRYYFHKSAADLTRREALLLAVSLPNPRVRNPARPTRRLLAIAGAVNARMPIIAHRAFCLLPTR